MGMIRTFVALEVSKSLRDRISRLIGRLRQSDLDFRWTSPDHFHFTLNFLGDVDELRIPSICQVIADIASATEPFEVVCTGLGVFPRPDHPRVLWVGVGEGSQQLIHLQRETTAALQELGFPKERGRYQPHLTIGRVKRTGSTAHLDAVSRLLDEYRDCQFGGNAMSEVVIFSSQLQRGGGPIYTPLSRVPLG